VEQTNSLPRAAAMLLSLQDVKTDYKAARVGSNELATVMATVSSALNQAQAWMTIVTNR
jgi:hypothetical protein